MYKRHTGQVSMLESPEMFGSLPLDPNNDWIKLSKFVPWREFDLKYADNFRSKKGQRACDSRMTLGSVLIKIHYKGMSDEDLTKEIAMNPYLQYFLGLQKYRYECPFDASILYMNLRKSLRLLLRLFSVGSEIRFRTSWRSRFLHLPEKWHLCR